MSKPFKTLTDKMSPQHRARAQARTHKMLVEMALADVRKALGMTQEQIAATLGMKQSAVSRLEAQQDMYVSTLSRVIKALGGRLKLVAEFKDKEFVINQFSTDELARSPSR